MGRIRTIKPEFFRHEDLFKAEKETKMPLRVAFAGLWTCADRCGRFRWQPSVLKLDVMPFDQVDFSRVLDALTTRGFIVRYASQGKEYGWIPSWDLHQVINNRESASVLPDPAECLGESITSTREARVDDASTTRHGLAQGEGKGREGEMEGEREGKGSCDARDASPTVPGVDFPLKDPGVFWSLPQSLFDELVKAYPNLDILAECRKARVWLVANDGKRKTATGMPRFLASWVERSQNDGRGQNTRRPAPVVQIDTARKNAVAEMMDRQRAEREAEALAEREPA